MPTAPEVDLTDQSMREVRQALGELTQMSLGSARAAIFVMRQDGVVTLLDARLLAKLPSVELAEALLRSWPDDQDIEEFLGFLDTLEK